MINKEVYFVILQVGSNEMSALDLKENKNTIFEKIQQDCDKIINLAQHMVREYEGTTTSPWSRGASSRV